MHKFAVVITISLVTLLYGKYTNGKLKDDNDRVVGGTAITIDQTPYQTSITKDGNHYCGGSIISAKHILTAAHCAYGTPLSSYAVHYGSSFLNSGGKYTSVEKFAIHPSYNKKKMYDYDISILFVKTQIIFDNTAAPIKLPIQNEIVAVGQIARISGWGRTSANNPNLPNQLQYIMIPRVDQNTCEQAYATLLEITDNMICFGLIGEGGKDACMGDSGGPVAVGDKLYGIVSFGVPCATARYPSVYTKVSNFINWTNSVVQTL